MFVNYFLNGISVIAGRSQNSLFWRDFLLFLLTLASNGLTSVWYKWLIKGPDRHKLVREADADADNDHSHHSW